MFVHFRCLPCKRVYGIRTDEGVKSRVAAPVCRSCDKVMNKSGAGAKKLRKGAIELTAASVSRQNRALAAAALVSKKREQLLFEKRFAKAAELSDDEEDEDDDDSDDEDFLPTPDHAYNIRMRLTPGAYAARATYGYDAGCVLRQIRSILGTAGRGVLNTIMGNHYKVSKPNKYAAWRHAGTTSYSSNKFASSEWCHLVADSLGGPSEQGNLVAASYSANTYMAAMEVLLKGQAGLQLEVVVRCSAPHIGEWILYRIKHLKSGLTYDVGIDALASNFNAADLLNVQTHLQTWLAARGIKVTLSA